MAADARGMIVLVRGCGALGRVLAVGLHDRGYYPVILDSRTAAGPAEIRLADLHHPHDARRELLALRRERGTADAIVLLPHLRAPIEDERWEQDAVDELLEATSMVRAASAVLREGAPLVFVPPTAGGSLTAVTSPIDAIVELAVSSAASEEGVPLIRAPLDGIEELGRGELTSQLLDSIACPADASQMTGDEVSVSATS